MRKFAILLLILLCGCNTGGIAELSDSSGTAAETTIAETTAITETEETKETEETATTISLDEEIQKRREEYKEWAKTENDYGASVIVKLKETDCDFSQEGKSMEEIIEILWNRNIVCFYTYYQYTIIYAYMDTDFQNSDYCKIIHCYFNSYEELKKFVQETYVSEYRNYRMYDDDPYYGDNETLMCYYYFLGSSYMALPFREEVSYKITNVTDDVCEFSCYMKYRGYYDYYVTFEVPCTAVKENGEWRLTEMIGEIFGYRDKIMEENGYTFESDLVPFETYKVHG